MASTTVTDKI